MPSNKEDFTEWVSQKDVVDFFVSDANDDDIILHASAKTTLLNTVLVLKNALSKSDPHQMTSWDYNNSGWSVCSGGGRDKSWVEPPLESCKPNVLSRCHESLCVIFNALEGHQQDKAGTQNI